MKISDFHFDVPSKLIALKPLTPRSAARLLSYDRKGSRLQHSTFRNLPEFLKAGDLLVFNNTHVIPARFYGRRQTGGEIEGLLLDTASTHALAWMKGKVNPGDQIEIEGFGQVSVLKKTGKRVELSCSRDELAATLKRAGHIPIPPYIVTERKRRNLPEYSLTDKAEYQSIFARETKDFSVAAPTASLHFDQELLGLLSVKGVETAELTLHVGEGTFAPVEAKNLSDHVMHFERVSIPADLLVKIRAIRAQGRRVIAVGTTVCRALEAAERLPVEKRGEFETSLFIKPPFEFKIVDGLITNFHWPDSTLVVLVATFLEAVQGRCPPEIRHDWRKIYAAAIADGYRFFSYGDGILIL